MARNGAGTYTLPAGNPVTTGTTISSTWANNTLSDIATSLTASLAYDGQTNPVANLPMAGYNHTGVGVATTRTNYAQAGQVQDGTYSTLTGVSGTDTITAYAAINLTSYVSGQYFNFISAGANTTTSVTLNINGIGAKNITKNGATALSIGDIASGQMISVIYDGTQFQLQTGVLGVTSFSAGTTGLTPSSLTKGSVTLAGTLATTNGGTNLTSFTSGGAMYATSTSALTTGTLPVASGGTGATTGGAALTNLLTPTTAGNVIFTTDGSNWSSTAKLLRGTNVSTTSGTSKTISDVPAWAKRITVLINGVTTSSASLVMTFNSVATGYSWTQSRLNATGTVTQGNASDTSFQLIQNALSASAGKYTIILANASTYSYILEGSTQTSTNYQLVTGRLVVGAVLSSITFSGVTFSAGEIDVIYE